MSMEIPKNPSKLKVVAGRDLIRGPTFWTNPNRKRKVAQISYKSNSERTQVQNYSNLVESLRILKDQNKQMSPDKMKNIQRIQTKT